MAQFRLQTNAAMKKTPPQGVANPAVSLNQGPANNMRGGEGATPGERTGAPNRTNGPANTGASAPVFNLQRAGAANTKLPGVQNPNLSGVLTGVTSQLQSPEERMQTMWEGIEKSSRQGLNDKLSGTYADEALNQRRMSEMNAAMGGSAGGGAFAGGSAQVALGGMQQRTNVRNEHHKQNLQLKMTYLQRMMEQAENEKDRDLQAWLQTESDKTATAIAGMGYQAQAADRAAREKAQEEYLAEQRRLAGIDPNDPDDAEDSWWEDAGEAGSSFLVGSSSAGLVDNPFADW